MQTQLETDQLFSVDVKLPGRADRNVFPALNHDLKDCPLWKVLPDNLWNGRRAFIIGGGPSLKGFNFDLLDGELTIGTNRSFEFMRPTILYSMDDCFWRDLLSDKYDDDSLAKFKRYDGFATWLSHEGQKHTDGGYSLKTQGPYGFTDSLNPGVGGGCNSGYGAINIAWALGARPIYLLGFDMHGTKDGRRAWHHSGHPNNKSQDSPGAFVYNKMIQRFEALCKNRKDVVPHIINLTPKSSLTCFKHERIETLRFQKRPVVVAYYTSGSGYADEVKKLQRSLRPWGLKFDIQCVNSRGDWQANTQYKARFIADMLEKHHPNPILYVDADATIERFPVLIESIASKCDDEIDPPIDVAVHYRYKGEDRPRELLSGTIYVNQSPEAIALIHRWVRECQRSPKEWDQRVLSRVIDNTTDLSVMNLPAEYCAIFDAMPEAGPNPIIRHYQASRRYKNGN